MIEKRNLVMLSIIASGIIGIVYASSGTIITDTSIITPELNATKIFLNNVQLNTVSSPSFKQVTYQVTTNMAFGVFTPAINFNQTATIILKGSTNFNGQIAVLILTQDGSYQATANMEYTTVGYTQIITLPGAYGGSGPSGTNSAVQFPYTMKAEVLTKATAGNLNMTITYN